MIRNDEELASDIRFVEDYNRNRPIAMEMHSREGWDEKEADLLLEPSDIFIWAKQCEIALYEELKKGIFRKEEYSEWELPLAMKILSGATLEEIGDHLGIDLERMKRLEDSCFNSPDPELMKRMMEFFEAKVALRNIDNP